MIRRAAFDIGSGSTKLQCCECELSRHPSGQDKVVILRTLFGVEKPVPFGSDLMRSRDGCLSSSIQDSGITIFLELKREAEKLGATEFSAIATEVFRRAANGKAYLAKILDLGVPVAMLSQKEEALLGYTSAQTELQIQSGSAFGTVE